MITAQTIAQQLNAYSTFFKSVTGAATIEQAVQEIPLISPDRTPAVSVVPVGLSATGDQNESGMYQSTIWRYAMVVTLSNVGDRTGYNAAELALEDVYQALEYCLGGWEPDNETTRGFYIVHAGLAHEESGAAKAVYVFEYEIEVINDDQVSWSNNPILLAQYSNPTSLVANFVSNGISINSVNL